MMEPTLITPPDAIARFEMRPASESLRGVVDRFWLFRLEPGTLSLVPYNLGERPLVVLGPDGLAGDGAPGFPDAYRHQIVVPDGMLDILMHLPFPGRAGSAAHPAIRAYACALMPVRRTFDIAFPIPSLIFITRFFPGAARDFVGVGANTLADRATPLEELWGAAATDFAREAGEHDAIADIVPIAERYLLTHGREPTEATAIVRRSVEAMSRTHGRIALEELREIAGRTERQLERLFKEYVGMSPKRLGRILRFDYLMTAVRNLEGVDWHDLIETLNYCDQPHLIREFRDFVGMSPAAFRAKMKRHLESMKRLEQKRSGESGGS